MVPEIIEKLQNIIQKRPLDESSVVHFIVLVRKLLESHKTEYGNLRFHCDWALHTVLKGTEAQNILAEFDKANRALTKDSGLTGLPHEVKQYTTMRGFRDDLQELLTSYNFNNISDFFHDWSQVMFYYSRIIADSPLVIRSDNANSSVKSVTVSVEVAKELQHGERFYKVSWKIESNIGKPGTLFVINSFADPEAH